MDSFDTLDDDFEPRSNRVTSTQWVAGTRVDLTTVRWDSDYRNIVEFDDQSDLDDYIDQRTSQWFKLEKLTHVRPYEPIRVNIPFHYVVENNYLRVHNPNQDLVWSNGNTGWRDTKQMNFYYFILDARYIAPNTTEVLVQLDVWQTYGYVFSPGFGYVERGHVGIANNQNKTISATYLTVPEGLDLGNDYVVTHTTREKIADTTDIGVMVWSTVDLHRSGGTVDNPRLYTANGSQFGDVPNGASAYYFSTQKKWHDWLLEHREEPWVTQGIIMVMAIPPLGRYGYSDLDDWESESGLIRPTGKPLRKLTNMLTNWRDIARSKLPAKYRHLDKFLTYPYTVFELTTNNGAPIVLKPENWRSSELTVQEVAHFALPSPRLMVMPLYYNASTEANTPGESDEGVMFHDGGEFTDVSTGIYDFPVFSVVNNSYISFLASSRNSIQHQHNTADWSQSKALRSADTSYDNATMGMDAADQQNLNQMNTMRQAQGIQDQFGGQRSMMNAGTSLGMGLVGGNPLSILGGAVSAATSLGNEGINRAERESTTTMNIGALRQSGQIQRQLGEGVRDANMSLSQFAARGDYQNQVAGINAKVQDAKLTQPTTSGQVGGEAFNLTTDHWGYDLKMKMVHPGAMRTIGDYWLKYGYAVNAEHRPDRLQVMTKYTYWKFTEFTISEGAIPEQYRNALRGIFEKGVTVWGKPDDIGNVRVIDNAPIMGDYYG